jgi:large subunit ribosomal protein L6
MSRIGRLPIALAKGVTASLKGETLTVKGPKGELVKDFKPEIEISIEDTTILVKRSSEEKFIRSLHGTYRSIIAGMVEGVTNGFSKKLEVVGSGYKAAIEKGQLKLLVNKEMIRGGVFLDIPSDLEVKVDNDVMITVSGIDKQKVGQFAINVRRVRPPEPYKGKGIKFADEQIKRKAGKKAI